MNLLKINFKSYQKEFLGIYVKFFINLLKKLNINFSLINLPNKKKRITLLKSPHVYKKAREQFEIHIYKKIIYLKKFKNLRFLNLLFINKPKLVNITMKYIGK